MEKFYFFQILRSAYCRVVFLLSLIGSYFLIPDKIFNGYYIVLAVVFMLAFSLSIACLARNIKERIKNRGIYHQSGIALIASIVGLGAMQVCGVGAGICTASLGISILASILPTTAMVFMTEYAVSIVVVTIILQIYSLWKMGCFAKRISHSS